MKIYLTELQNDLPLNQIDINKLNDFEGLVFDCIQLEPIKKSVIVGNRELFTGYTFKYEFEMENYYNKFRNKFDNTKFMFWIVTDDYIYINEDLKTGFICTLDYDAKNNLVTAKSKSPNYFYRTERK